MTELPTPRLLLRQWREADLPAFAALNADPEVRRFFGKTLTREESDASVGRFRTHIDAHGFGFWAVEVPGVAPFAPAVEIGWRLARGHWNQGYATEGARAALAHGFGPLGLQEIVSFAVPGNTASRRVMQKIGMTQDLGGSFDYPLLAEGHPLRRHVLYRTRSDNAWVQGSHA